MNKVDLFNLYIIGKITQEQYIKALTVKNYYDKLFESLTLSIETMSENKRERDANGRFVKKTDGNLSVCKKPDYEMMYKSVDKAFREISSENRELVKELHKSELESKNLRLVLNCQRSITKEISSKLNWFQRIRLRKILAQYPYDMYGYYMEKDV